jgi:hypothetical protein
VDVVPSTGVAVDGSVGGTGVSDAGAGMVGGKVEVIMNVVDAEGFRPHPEINNAIVMTEGSMILCTQQL